MPIDAVFLQALVKELTPQVLDLRIDKIQQPARDQVILQLRFGRRLLLHAGTGAARLQMTALPRDNPLQPPVFCMLLRKHLSGARITALCQPPMERLVRIQADTVDELGRPGRRTLVLEAMGRRSNLILLDEDGRILACLRRVEGEAGREPLLPGLFYRPPEGDGRPPFTQAPPAALLECLRRLPQETPVREGLLKSAFGLSPILAREGAFAAAGDTEARFCQLDAAGWEGLERWIDETQGAIKEERFTPYLLFRQGEAFDFSPLPLGQYGPEAARRQESFSALLDAFCAQRELRQRQRQRGAEVLRAAQTARDRLARKLGFQEQDYAKALDREGLRVSGDLITANLYRMERGMKALRCENYFDPALGEITIALDERLSPQQNAAQYYKRYAKAKAAEGHLSRQMALTRRDISYLDSVLQTLEQAETEQDLLDIRAELTEAGFLKKPPGKKTIQRPAGPRAFCTRGGFRVLVGRSNRQNDRLTFQEAHFRDLWFHVQGLHGAHVILRTEGRAPDQADLEEAARLAAFYSQGRHSSGVPVDYTEVKYVKKPAGARPGMVVYSRQRTLSVTPEPPPET